MDIPCSHCTGSFRPVVGNQRYCSERCQRKAAERRREQRTRDRLATFKLEAGCALCPPGTRWPAYVLEFHHQDPATKFFDMSRAHKYGTAAIAELAKCEVLCAGHHRMVEAGDLTI